MRSDEVAFHMLEPVSRDAHESEMDYPAQNTLSAQLANWFHAKYSELAGFWRDWWVLMKDTDCSDFRASAWSRRTIWPITIPTFFIIGVAFDYTNAMYTNTVFGMDVMCMLVVIGSVGFLERQSLRPDAVIVTATLANCMIQTWNVVSQVHIVSDSVAMQMLSSSLFGNAQLFGAYGVLGFHTCVLYIGCSVFTLHLFLVVPLEFFPVVMEIVAIMFAFFLVCAFLDSNCYRMFLLEVANKKLLEDGSDGFCRIKLSTGTIVEVSDGFRETFEDAELVGQRFVDFLQPGDETRFQVLLEESCATLVTCVLPASGRVVDAKLIPYYRWGNTLRICLQRQGELREKSEVPDLENALTRTPSREPSQHGADSILSFSLTAPSSKAEAVNTRMDVLPEDEHVDQGKSTSASSHHRAEEVLQGVQNKSSASAKHDKGTDPLICWSTVGWQCGRCAKPPLLPDKNRPEPKLPSRKRRHKQRPRGPGRTDGADNESPTEFDYINLSTGAGDARSSGGSETEGSSEQTKEIAVEEGSTPQISTFRNTPPTTLYFMLTEVLNQWNLPRLGMEACCPWHTATIIAYQIIKKMKKEPCKPLWAPFCARQCPQCLAMHEHLRADTCAICGEEMLKQEDADEPHADAVIE